MTDRGHYEQADLWGAGSVALPDHQEQRLRAIDQLLPADATQVIDVGAGDGRVLHHLMERRRGLNAVAAERSAEALGHVRGPQRAQASIDRLPFRDRSVDAVLCCEVLEHLPEPVFRQGLAELERVAGRHIVVTVPNREVRRRGDVTCSSCGCRYNRERHLRSFHPEQITSSFREFALEQVIETGPRQPVYPRALRTTMERSGLLPVLGSPSCPQCDEVYLPERQRPATGASGDGATSRYRAVRRVVPKQRHPYWLCLRFTRSGLS